MTLVEIRCEVRGCGALLDRVESAPAAEDERRWAGYVCVHVCPRHGGGHGSVGKWVAAQVRLGRPHDRVSVRRWIPWADLRAMVETARRTGTCPVYPLTPTRR